MSGNVRYSRYVSDISEIKVGEDVTVAEQEAILMKIHNSTSNDIATLEKGLLQEIARDVHFNFAWSIATAKFFQAAHPNFRQEGVPNLLHVVQITYVLDTEFYDNFNKATRELRTSSEVNCYPYKNYYKLLFLSIVKVKGCPYYAPIDLVLYRGLKGKFSFPVGQKVCFQQFLSTSRNEEVAQGFSKGGTVLVILDIMKSGLAFAHQIGIRGNPNCTSLDHIGELLEFEEEETLIWPTEKFKVVKVEDRYDGYRYVYLRT